MAIRSLRRRMLLLAVVAGVAALLVPLATGQENDLRVDACFEKRDGDLRVDVGGGCKHNEEPIALARHRVRPAVVHVVPDTIDVPDDVSESEGAVMNRLELNEAGEHVIIGKAVFRSEETGATVACLIPGGGEFLKFGVPGDTTTIVPILSEASGPRNVDLVCEDSPGGDTVHLSSQLVAIPVDELVSNRFE